ncbi:MAG: DUF2971 domain-containing protein [Verrucomicrobiia bacterium]
MFDHRNLFKPAQNASLPRLKTVFSAQRRGDEEMKTDIALPMLIQSPLLTDETRLYRYMGLSQLMAFLETKQTSLTRIGDWEDTWEVPLAKLPIQSDDGPVSTKHYSIFETMYGQCWSLNEESDAMWRIYSPKKEGIVIQTSVKNFRLLQGLIYAALGPVFYCDDLKTTLEQKAMHREYDVFTEAFLKRRAFDHEKEVRLVTMDDPRCVEKRASKRAARLNFDLDPLQFLEGIRIDPRADDRHVEVLQKYCARHGFQFRPVKSNLYSDVFEETRLVTRYVSVPSGGKDKP